MYEVIERDTVLTSWLTYAKGYLIEDYSVRPPVLIICKIILSKNDLNVPVVAALVFADNKFIAGEFGCDLNIYLAIKKSKKRIKQMYNRIAK